jgi:uncharacterized membrane protein
MSLAPLLNAAPAIPVHAFAAMAAFVLGEVQFATPNGTRPHRAHRHEIADYRLIMMPVFLNALVIAGLFTLLPVRIMRAVVFGP